MVTPLNTRPPTLLTLDFPIQSSLFGFIRHWRISLKATIAKFSILACRLAGLATESRQETLQFQLLRPLITSRCRSANLDLGMGDKTSTF